MASVLLYVALALFTGIFYLLRKFNKKFEYFKDKGVPQLEIEFFYGNGRKFIKKQVNRGEFFRNIYDKLKKMGVKHGDKGVPQLETEFFYGNGRKFIKKQVNRGEFFRNIYDKLKKMGVKHGGVYISLNSLWVPIDPDLIKTILIKDFTYFSAHVPKFSDSLFFNNLFLMDGEEWKDMRKKLTPTFTSGKMKMMYNIVLEKTNGLSDLVGKISKTGEPADIKELLARFTTDIVGSCGFGIECNSIEDINSEFFRQGQNLFRDAKEPSTFHNILVGLGIRKFRPIADFGNIENFFRNVVRDTINYREEKKIIRKDFLHLMIQLKNKGVITELTHENEDIFVKTVDNVFIAMDISRECTAQIENGDTELALPTQEPTENQEYVNPYPITNPCYRFADIINRQFFSPAYPPDAPTYPNNTNCSVVLTAPKNHQIELDFRDEFEVERSENCRNDYLEVRDGQYGFNNVLLHFCGIHEFPPKVKSSDRHLWVYFKSDENIEGKGFRAVFDFVPRANATGIPEIRECKKEISYREEGKLGRDDIDPEIIQFDKQHGIPIDCMWVITVRLNWRIQLQFEKFELDHPNDCESNFVEVFSNDTINSKKKFCGSIADTVLSDNSHNVLIVRFYAEFLGNKTTFFANFTAFREYTKEKSKTVYCEDDEFDCEDATCISSTLKCNGFYNCRFRWDEDNCQGSESWALTDDHIVIIMVIFSLILTGMFFTFIYNCIKKLLRDHQTIQEFKRSREQLDKDNEEDKRSSKGNGGPHRTPSVESTRFGPSESVNTPCYVPGDDILPILIKNSHTVPSNGSLYNQNIYTVDNDEVPKMCDSACQTRESLFTTQEYSSGNTTPNNSVHTNSPPAPFSTFGYNRKDNKFKAEAKIEMHHEKSMTPSSKYDKRYSVQTTKSAPDVIVTH